MTPKHPSSPCEYGFELVRIVAHDEAAFTQGLAYRDGYLYESTGLYGRSSLRKLSLKTGEIVQQVDLAPEFFGEGLALLQNEIVQLTWQSQTAFVYDMQGFRPLRRFTYQGEGWGLAAGGGQLFMSDGSHEIRVLDGKTFAEQWRIPIYAGKAPIAKLNDLEVVEGELFANVWQTDRVASIDMHDGTLLGWLSLESLAPRAAAMDADAVLNGIAYDPVKKHVFVTGKLWPSIYEIVVSRR